MQYINVDVYGKCGNKSCETLGNKSTKKCYENMNRNYKFYLSLENSICKVNIGKIVELYYW